MMKEPIKIPGYTYRNCRKCKQEWTVSCLEPGGKNYVCPWCEAAERRKEREAWSRNNGSVSAR
nr:MAG TPA: hypothetical protein [Caudoviricetes sp.]